MAFYELPRRAERESTLEFILNAQLFADFPQQSTVQGQRNGYPVLAGLMTFYSIWTSHL